MPSLHLVLQSKPENADSATALFHLLEGPIAFVIRREHGDPLLEELNPGDALEPEGRGTGGVVTDFNGDGMLDLILSHGESMAQPLSVFRGSQGFSNNWLRVVPRTQFGAFARGAKVVLYTKNSGAHLRIIDGGSGYLCEMEPVAHFGLDGKMASRSVASEEMNSVLEIPYPRDENRLQDPAPLECGRGFSQQENGHCVDKPVCVNTYGSYRCRTNKRCSRGYEPNEDGTACVAQVAFLESASSLSSHVGQDPSHILSGAGVVSPQQQVHPRRRKEVGEHKLVNSTDLEFHGGRITGRQRPCGSVRKSEHWEIATGAEPQGKTVLVDMGFGPSSEHLDPRDPDQPHQETARSGRDMDHPARGQGAQLQDSRGQSPPPAMLGPENGSEAGALVAQPPQVCKALSPAVHLPAGTPGQSPGPPAAPAAAAAGAAAAGAPAAAPVLIDGNLDLRPR
ncbi:hypothetical protein MC885_016200 [Smutsia gigantea]|nr:hypothetical protein MC885_016200 [Smutsia gigantea]